jgi:hypothetical protein
VGQPPNPTYPDGGNSDSAIFIALVPLLCLATPVTVHQSTAGGNGLKVREVYFRSGERIPASGIYVVHHDQHRLPQEVTLLRGESFPPCSRCSGEVRFKRLRAIKALDEMRERIILHALPPLPAEPAVSSVPASDGAFSHDKEKKDVA